MAVDRKINWNNPQNFVSQHRLRYQDGLLHASFVDTSKTFLGQNVGVNGVLSPKELKAIQSHVLFNRRKNFKDTGASEAEQKAVDENIGFGTGQWTDKPDEVSGVIIFKRKL